MTASCVIFFSYLGPLHVTFLVEFYSRKKKLAMESFLNFDELILTVGLLTFLTMAWIEIEIYKMTDLTLVIWQWKVFLFIHYF